tara:strand:- start:6676 stop:8421 length:1746 start_codon:yes stop_codon:yes gene_type:complete
MSNRPVSLFISILLLTSVAPVALASAPSDSNIWGITYDWANLDDDQETLTGVSPMQFFEDLELAAMIAKFDLDALSVISGNTLLFIEQWEDDGTTQIQDGDGDIHTVIVRNTEITLRHGSRNDQGVITSWQDGNSSIDISYRAAQNAIAVFDILYTEYLTTNLEHIGGDMSITGSTNQESELQLEVDVQGGGESFDADIEFEVSSGFSVDSITSEWRTLEPIGLLRNMSYDGAELNSCWDSCGMVSGDYLVSANYDFSLSGVPTDELGLSADILDLSISDTVTSAGAFYEDFDTRFYAGEKTPACNGLNPEMEVNLGVGTDVEVQCRQVLPPFSPGLLGMAAVSIISSFTDSSSFEAASQELAEEIESIADDVEDEIVDEEDDDSSADDIFVCDDGTEIPAYWVNDGEEDCPDGSDEYGTELDGPEAMIEAWSNSDLGSTMSTFIETLNELLSDNVENPVIELENACLTTLWDSSESMVVGAAWMQDGYMIVGPEIDGVGDHNVQFGIDYLVGDDARAAQAEASNLDNLGGLAPPSQHDAREVDGLVGEEEAESGLFVPAVSMLSTLALLGASALSQRRNE